VTGITGSPDTFQLTRLVKDDDAPLELHGTAARLFVQQMVVVEDGLSRTESYSYCLQADASPQSWLIRWDYRREPPRTDYAYPRAHVHVNGMLSDLTVISALHIPTRRVPLELVIRHLITEWGVKPKSEDWQAILDESVEGLDKDRFD
jgi:hypothetical protein